MVTENYNIASNDYVSTVELLYSFHFTQNVELSSTIVCHKYFLIVTCKFTIQNSRLSKKYENVIS